VRPDSLSIAWRTRDLPLVPSAVAAAGAASLALARRLLDRDDASLAALRGVAARGVLVAFGESETLPWVDGVVYLGVDARAPGILLPTAIEPSVPVELFAIAIAGRFDSQPPLAVIPQSGLVLSLAAARSIVRESVVRWLEKES